MSGAPVIRCVELSRWYGEVQGLSGLTVEITPGVVGLLGPNGSGKTTLMRLLTGLARPSRGHAELFGVRVGPDAWPVFRRVGYVPGDDVHLEGERAVDFLTLLARLGGEGEAAARRRAEAALDRVGLAEAGGKRLRAMSKGMRQRVKVAQALLLEPELWLLDEPLNGMDPVSRRQVMDLVRGHAQGGGTVLFASHVLHEVEAITDRVLMLHHGRLLAEGRLEEIRGLLERQPRRVRLDTPEPRRLAARLLDEGLVAGVRFRQDGSLHVDALELPPLLARVQDFGAEGMVTQMEVADEDLEAVFDLLLEFAP